MNLKPPSPAFQVQPPSPALSRIEALAYRFRNADGPAMEAAAENVANGCPAFWHMSTATGGVSGLMSHLNATQDVARAWASYEAEWHRPCPVRSEKMLDLLLPLNEGAMHSLLNAYGKLDEPSFRTSRELFARVDKADDQALDALRALRKSGGNGIGALDLSRVDEAERAVAA